MTQILYVDGNFDNVLLMRRIAAVEGCGFLTEASGGGAINAILEHRPEVVIVAALADGEPIMQLANRIRQETNGTRPILILAATAAEATPELASAAGYDAFLMKPAGINEIRKLLQQQLSRLTNSPLPEAVTLAVAG